MDFRGKFRKTCATRGAIPLGGGWDEKRMGEGFLCGRWLGRKGKWVILCVVYKLGVRFPFMLVCTNIAKCAHPFRKQISARLYFSMYKVLFKGLLQEV